MSRTEFRNDQIPGRGKSPLRDRVVNGCPSDAQAFSEGRVTYRLDDCCVSGVHARHYPPLVTFCKTTDGHLGSASHGGNLRDMPATGKDIARPDFSEIGERLSRLRTCIAPKLSQADWADAHGFNRTQWNNWETGKRRISVDAAERLCLRYGLTLDWVYRGRVDGLPESLRNSL